MFKHRNEQPVYDSVTLGIYTCIECSKCVHEILEKNQVLKFTRTSFLAAYVDALYEPI